MSFISPVPSPIVPARKVLLRRGSASASDPYGKHLDINANPARTISSKLTIVRVESQQTDQEPPRSSSPQQFRDRRQHKRHGSNSSLGSNQGESGRLSFAFTTFGPTNGSTSGRSSPTSGRTTPGSPGGPPQRKILSFSKPRLAPEQVIELAKSSTHPKSSLSNISAPSIPASTSAPNFTPLPDDVYLPFIDRPAEVSVLISTPPTAKLFTLLTQAFPLDARQLDDNVTLEDFVEKDPKSWTHPQLEYWFRHVDRDIASDEEWASKARACVHSHSELLWERIKGALGVPPELDVSEEEVEEDDIGGLDASVADFVLSPIDTTHKPDFCLVSHSPGNYADVFDDDFDTPPISIEPVFAMDPSTSSSVDPQVGLGDISEAVEEEAENADAEEDTSPPPKQEEVVHGLRISTSFSSPVSHVYGNTPSALASPIAMGGGGDGGVNSLSNSGNGYKLRRSNSSSSSIHADGRFSPYSAYRGTHDDDYPNGIERGLGSPLFPSNFANLAASPTLRPSIQRRSSVPHQPWNSNPHAIRMALAKRRGSNFAMSDYAMTTASEGSVTGEAA
ncbi:hypothetical protein BDM02DRAFT_3112553 [Thelephora ganbajun]|uniref:Uncharacterized protein n=1 Tax=Thelephora ganbajun TaxID=370292 RepID=A0ACB6ZKK0_THEGA|nr:hypothetical protein BDM02DRAFT_3112553 [Thelephora ganbajun]